MYITQGLHRSLQQTPDRVGTICGDRKRTFAEIGDRIARLAGALQGLGVAKGDRVAILSLNSDRYLEYLFGVPWSDAVLNPINTRWSDQEVAYCLNDSDSRVLLVDDALAPMVPALREQVPNLATVIHAGDGPTPDGMLAWDLERRRPAAFVRTEGWPSSWLDTSDDALHVPMGSWCLGTIRDGAILE